MLGIERASGRRVVAGADKCWLANIRGGRARCHFVLGRQRHFLAESRCTGACCSYNAYFVTAQKGWAVGHAGVVLRTVNSGAAWSKQSTVAALKQDAPDHVFFDVYFSDECRGFVVGAYGSLLATTDGGDTPASWQGHISDNKERHLYCIRAIGSLFYIAGEQGTFFRSRDGGETFTRIRTPYSGSYFGILADTNNNLIIFGFGGHAYRSRDAGDHWQRIETGSTAALTAGSVLTDGRSSSAVRLAPCYAALTAVTAFSLYRHRLLFPLPALSRPMTATLF